MLQAVIWFLLGLVGAVVLLVLGVVVGLWYLKRKLAGFLKALGGGTMAPLVLDLWEAESPAMRDAKDVTACVKAFEAEGFTVGKVYGTNMCGVELLTLYKAPYVGVIYWANGALHAFDIVFKDTDDTSVCATTQKYQGIPKPANAHMINVPGANVSEVFAKARAAVAEHSREDRALVIDEHNIIEQIKMTHRRDMLYLCNQGGITRERFEQQARDEAPKMEAAEVEKRFHQFKQSELLQWHDCAMDEYARQQEAEAPVTGADADEDGEEGRDDARLFIAPPKVYVKAYIDYLRDQAFIEDGECERLASLYSWTDDPVVVIEAVNTTRPEARRAVFAGVVDFPFEGKIYRIGRD